ncbi:MAG TPA: SIMPL domain-containing protein [Vicinamibacterales bacterium]|nr:SIMPL domain-containing protein [Vicinamibacterales bacterium]
MRSVLVALVALASVASSAFAQASGPAIVPPLQPTVVTRGQASVTARPDRAFVTIAAESRSRVSSEAQKQNATAMTAVLQQIEKAGVPKDAVRTVGYELQPEFDYANGRQTFRSYVARNTVEIRLDDIDRVGVVIDAAAAGGATTITGVRFDVRDRAALERDALRRAVADARARAEAAAAGAGATFDRVVRIEEEGAPEFPRPMMRLAGQSVERSAPTPVEPSTIEIHSRVTLTASLR